MDGPRDPIVDATLAEVMERLNRSKEPFAVATVVYRKPPVSSHMGDRAVITADGQIHGWIGGSCSQPVVRREAAAAIQTGRPRLLRLTREGAEEDPGDAVRAVTMTCPSGGEVEIYIEPRGLEPGLIAVGDTPLARALVTMAPTIGLGAKRVDRESPGSDMSDPSWGLSDWASSDPVGSECVVVATAGYFDEEALDAALRRNADYIALVASRRRARAVFDVLKGQGHSEADLERVQSPAGLDIGATTQEEIALSILAEIVSFRRKRMAEAPTFDAGLEEEVAVDPVCGMEVGVADALHSAEYRGKTFHFCCAHCRMTFLADPERYAPSSP